MRQAILDGIISLMSKDAPTGKRMLDLSCGAGASSAAYAALGMRVTPTNYLAGQFNVPGMECIRVDLNRPLPFPDASYDYAALQEVIEHLEDVRAVFNEIGRVLRPGGVLLLTTPNRLNMNSRVNYLFTGFFRGCHKPIAETASRGLPNWHVLDLHVLIWLAHTAGFRLDATAAGHAKIRSRVYGILLYPWVWAGTQLAVRRGALSAESRRMLARRLLGPHTLFNENLILRFVKADGPGRSH